MNRQRRASPCFAKGRGIQTRPFLLAGSFGGSVSSTTFHASRSLLHLFFFFSFSFSLRTSGPIPGPPFAICDRLYYPLPASEELGLFSSGQANRDVYSHSWLPRPQASDPGRMASKKKEENLLMRNSCQALDDHRRGATRDLNQPHPQSFQPAAPVAYANPYPTLSKQDSDSLLCLSINRRVWSTSNAASEPAIVHPHVGTPGGFFRNHLNPPHA